MYISKNLFTFRLHIKKTDSMSRLFYVKYISCYRLGLTLFQSAVAGIIPIEITSSRNFTR